MKKSFRLYWPNTNEHKFLETDSDSEAFSSLQAARNRLPQETIFLQLRTPGFFDTSSWENYVPMEAKKQIARDALQVQDACNASGVVSAFARAMHTLCEIDNAERKGTNWKNSHPVVFLFAHKIMSLAGHEDLSEEAMKKYREATLACEELAQS